MPRFADLRIVSLLRDARDMARDSEPPDTLPDEEPPDTTRELTQPTDDGHPEVTIEPSPSR
jgi:hypothetical protein